MSATLASTFICSTCVTVSLGSSGSAGAAGSPPVGGAGCGEEAMGAAAGAGVGGGSPPLGWALACCGLRFRLRAVCCGRRADPPPSRRTMWHVPSWWTRTLPPPPNQLTRWVGPAQIMLLGPVEFRQHPPGTHGATPFPSHTSNARPSTSQGSASAWRLGGAQPPPLPSRGF
jgi:hypothetical protein